MGNQQPKLNCDTDTISFVPRSKSLNGYKESEKSGLVEGPAPLPIMWELLPNNNKKKDTISNKFVKTCPRELAKPMKIITNKSIRNQKQAIG